MAKPGGVVYRPFTEAEIEAIRTRYATDGPAKLSREFGRPSGSIMNRAYAMGLRYTGPKRWTTPHSHRSRIWTDDEDNVLRREWPKIQARTQSVQRVADLFHTTINQCRIRAGYLGLRRARVVTPPWTPAEDELLESLVHRSLPWIASQLRRAGFHRTESAIATRRERLRLTTRENGDFYSACELSRLLGCSTVPVLRWIRMGWLKAIPRTCATNKAGGPGDQYLIKAGDVRQFIILHTAQVAPILATADKQWLVDTLTMSEKGIRPVLRQDSAGFADSGIAELRVAA